ncbi:MAG: DUF72 domain-containing protein [Burkholderiaceae bacterium]
MIAIGTAGWTIPRAAVAGFPLDGRHLERYARVMNCVEINSSFHRPHRTATYARWVDETPDGFRFAVKLPKTITHGARLRDFDALLDPFVAAIRGLGSKLGALLVQLPPSSAFDRAVVTAFFDAMRRRHDGAIVCEPRHASWFTAEAEEVLIRHRIARAAADPASIASAAEPGGWLGDHGDGRDALAYYRWHGSPRMYWSAYDDAWLRERAEAVGRWPEACDVWCVFDNTAAGAATADALRFAAMTRERGGQSRTRLATDLAIAAAPPR